MTDAAVRRRPPPARKATEPARGSGGRRAGASPAAVARSPGLLSRLFSRLFGWVPLNEHQLQRLFLALILLGALALAVTVGIAAGLPQLAAARFARIAADAGFEVHRVDVRGVRHMNEMRVYERVLSQRDQSMPLVDLDAVRQDLLGLSWVKDARVSRQLPDALVIDIVERTPHAVLRKPGGRLMLIDQDGRELEPIAAAKVGAMLVVSGPASGQRTVELDRLLAAAPALRPQLREAAWIGNRRWNLTFRTGQVLALPEGATRAADALVTFARLDGTSHMLGSRATAFDMRSGDRLYLRVPGLAQEEAAAAKSAKLAAARSAGTTAAKETP